jgi:hypothetical protein
MLAQFSALLSTKKKLDKAEHPFTARSAVKSVKSPEIPTRSSGVGASRRVQRDEKLCSL